MRSYVVAGLALLLLSACSPSLVSDGSGKPATANAPSSAKAPAEPATWGKRYTWPDGLAVEVAAPVACKPSEIAAPQGIKRAVKFKILVLNNTDKPFDVSLLALGGNAQFNEAKAEEIFDTDSDCGKGGLETATVVPGKTYSYEVAYSVGTATGDMQLVFEPHITAAKAIFAGKA